MFNANRSSSSLAVDRELYDIARGQVIRLIPIPVYFKNHIDASIDLSIKNVCLCPFHSEKTPSFRYDPSGDPQPYWRCFGKCQIGGTVIELHKFKNNINNHFDALWDLKVRFAKQYNLDFENFFIAEGLTNKSVEEIVAGAMNKKQGLSFAEFAAPKLDNPTILSKKIKEKLEQIRQIDIDTYAEMCIAFDNLTVYHNVNVKSLTEVYDKVKAAHMDCITKSR